MEMKKALTAEASACSVDRATFDEGSSYYSTKGAKIKWIRSSTMH